MKLRITKPMAYSALLVVLTLVAASTLALERVKGAEAQNESESQARKLEGTWRVLVTIRNCQTGDALGSPFRSLVAFARGGTRTEVTAGSSPALRSPALGTWQYTGGHTYSSVSEAYIFNPAGVWIGTQTLRQSIEISDNPDVFNAS